MATCIVRRVSTLAPVKASSKSAAPIIPLDKSPIGPGYRAAPEVFYFAPQKLWYLIFQGGDPFYSTTANIGDPIIVRGTEVQLENGNGWTAWNITWAQYVQGSALPVPPEIAALPGVDPLTGASPKSSTDTVVGAAATPSPTR